LKKSAPPSNTNAIEECQGLINILDTPCFLWILEIELRFGANRYNIDEKE
jgi:hypothetical protein